MSLLRRAAVIVGATACFSLVAGPASAHDCIHAEKTPDSQSVIGTYDIASDTFTPSDHPGKAGHIAIRFPDGTTIVTFTNVPPSGVVEGARNCDGNGLDSFEACMGI
jgi:hypothetical protein